MQFTDILKTILIGVDKTGSSKRALLIWIGIIIYTFVHIMIFCFIHPFKDGLADTLIMYDVMLIGSLAGINVVERIYNNKTAPKAKEEGDK